MVIAEMQYVCIALVYVQITSLSSSDSSDACWLALARLVARPEGRLTLPLSLLSLAVSGL